MSCRFASDETEAEFQSYAFERSLASNRLAVSVGGCLFALYSVLDLVYLQDPLHAIVIRLTASAACAFLVACLFQKNLIKRHVQICFAISIIISVTMNHIIWYEPSLENNYYVGLIQASVFLSFLIRIGFLPSCVVLAIGHMSFMVAVANKTDSQEATLQAFIMLTMFAICAFGIYLGERSRRNEFLQAKTITEQNIQLNEMLAEITKDNERKRAAMNLLVHYVKTPIHQIVGFTDVMLTGLRHINDPSAMEQVANAEFVKTASSDLSKNVAQLLAYYRLDEQMSSGQNDSIAASDLADELAFALEGKTPVDNKADYVRFTNNEDVVFAGIKALAAYFADKVDTIKSLTIEFDLVADKAIFSFVFDGPLLDRASFDNEKAPLTQIENYLDVHGSDMPMALRIFNRSASLAGGTVTLDHRSKTNVITVEFADASAGEAKTDIPDSGEITEAA
ncbi:MAG: hypothetical protein AAF668_08570 [Pseudomonadota bacterium]